MKHHKYFLSMINRGVKSYNYHTINILERITNINQWRKEFIIETFLLFLSFKGRVKFLQLSCYVNHEEQRYRQQVEIQFDFLSFNKEITQSHESWHYAIVFDACYIRKKTPRLVCYLSDWAGQAKWGLEIGSLVVIDIDNHTTFHLETVQKLNIQKKGKVTQILAYEHDLLKEGDPELSAKIYGWG